MDAELLSLVRGAGRVAALTGAGVSTLSGLPDFRGPTGLYADPRYARAFDLDLFRDDPGVFYGTFGRILFDDKPLESSLVHNTLAAWESEGTLEAVITQNIDCLHQRAGSTTVLELHGSPRTSRCLTCGQSFSLREMQGLLAQDSLRPRCGCGGAVKPDITFFGEELPAETFEHALRLVRQTDLLLVLGTSLTVYPAASLPRLCLEQGGRLVIVNSQPTSYDREAVLVLRDLEQAFG